MNILLTNDDGVYSIGIPRRLQKTYRRQDTKSSLFAPDRERSGCVRNDNGRSAVHIRNINRLFLSADFEAKRMTGLRQTAS